MDSAILSATSALVGSVIGGAATLAASLLTQRKTLQAQTRAQEAAKREALYAEFIVEATKRLADAWNHQAEGPEVTAGLFSAVERMRLTSSDEVVRAAQGVVSAVVESYAAPNRTFDEMRQRLKTYRDRDTLSGFSEVCRAELNGLQRRPKTMAVPGQERRSAG